MKKKLYRISVALLAVVFLAGCYSTSLTNEWTNPRYESKKLNKIAVVVIMKSGVVRQEIETYMVDYLNKNGLNAVEGSRVLKDTSQLPEQKIEAMFNDAGIDAVLTMRKVAVDKQMNVVSPTVYPYPRAYYNRFYSYYYTSWDAFASPGYVRMDKTFRIENNLYEADNDEVIWTAVSNTMNPTGKQDLAQSIGKQIIRQFKKKGFISE